MKPLLSLIAITALSGLLLAGNGYARGSQLFQQDRNLFQQTQQLNCDANVTSTLPVYNLSYKQQSTIEFMYEEEKMARDVYLKMYEKYSINIFKSIANSEQKHMDSMKALLDKYSLSVAIDENNVGEFINTDLQKLYTQFVEQGSQSLEEALKVGQTIENVDIADLVIAISEANEDAKIVYNNLKFGSEKHLAAFTRLLDGSNQTSNQTYRGKAQSKGRR